MNTISNGVYRPIQKLHPPSLLSQFIDQAASGCLQLSSGSSLWFLHLVQGQLIYASDLIDPFGRLDRHLRRMMAQTGLTSAVRVQVRLMFETPTADQQTQGSDYEAICWLVEQQHLTAQQAADLIEAMVREVIDAFLPIQTGSYELIQQDLLAEFPTFCQLDLQALLDECQAQMRYRQSGLPTFPAKPADLNPAVPEGQTAAPNSTPDPAIERLLSTRFRSFLPSDRLSNSSPSTTENGFQRNWRHETWRDSASLSSPQSEPEPDRSAPATDERLEALGEPYGQGANQNSSQNSSQNYDQNYNPGLPEAVSSEAQERVEPLVELLAEPDEYGAGYEVEYAQVEQPSAPSEAGSSAENVAESSTDLTYSAASAEPFLSEAIRETPFRSESTFAPGAADDVAYGAFGRRSYRSGSNLDHTQSDQYSRQTNFDRSSELTDQDRGTSQRQQFRALRTSPSSTSRYSPGSGLAQTPNPQSGAASDQSPESSPPISLPAQSAGGKTYTIACIDDSPTVLQAIKGFLDDKSLVVVLISDPVKALMQIIRTRPDLILLDVTMPNLDGYELCSLLRKHPGFRNTPIVMVTSSTGFIDRAKAKLVGSSGYLTKPFTQTDLLKIVFKHLN